MINKILVFLLLISITAGAGFAAGDEVKDFEKAKILLFDKKWEQAEKSLKLFRRNYPESKKSAMALFYIARCNEETGNSLKAFNYYRRYLDSDNAKSSIMSDARIGIIDAAFEISRRDSSYLKYIRKYLKGSWIQARYYAAFKLSYSKDKRVAVLGVPVLKQIVTDNDDEDLVERARIALMRINPSYLKDRELMKTDSRYSIIKIDIYDKVEKKSKVSLSFPLALGKLMLGALDEADQNKIFNGESINSFLEKMMKSGEMLKVDSDTELIRVWLE